MNHEELCRLNNEVDAQAREENRKYRTLRENAEMRHKEQVRIEHERYVNEMRKLRMEHETKMDEINGRKDIYRVEFAKEKDRQEALEAKG